MASSELRSLRVCALLGAVASPHVSLVFVTGPSPLPCRNMPQLFGILGLSSLPCEFFYAPNREGKTPADLLPMLLPPQLHQLHALQKAAATGELQQQAKLQQHLSAVSCNLRAWRSIVFEYAAKASLSAYKL